MCGLAKRLCLLALAVSLVGCVSGAIMELPVLSEADLSKARQELGQRQISAPMGLADSEMLPRLNEIWSGMTPAVLEICKAVFATGCVEAMSEVQVYLLDHEGVNASADVDGRIFVNKGLLRAVGSDHEIAAVLAHEVAHVLFSHPAKSSMDASMGGMLGRLLSSTLVLAVVPGVSPHTVQHVGGVGAALGAVQAVARYSPEMELEADQFAMQVMHRAVKPVEAMGDLVVRVHRGGLPLPTGGGKSWASYLNTHPADDARLASMQAMRVAFDIVLPNGYAIVSKKGATWARRAAAKGDPVGQTSLAWIYAVGLGVLRDEAEAVKWYQLARDQGEPGAQMNLAWRERGKPPMFPLIQSLAEQGMAIAQNNLGSMHLNGWGVAKDASLAAKWYRKAADQGLAIAQYNLGALYADVLQDDAKAVQWYRKAADQEYADAQNNLGWMYQYGRGVPQDHKEARKWYRLAAKQGHALAKGNLKALGR